MRWPTLGVAIVFIVGFIYCDSAEALEDRPALAQVRESLIAAKRQLISQKVEDALGAKKKKTHPRLESVLHELYTTAIEQGAAAAQGFGQKRGIRDTNGMVQVIVEMDPEYGTAASLPDDEGTLEDSDVGRFQVIRRVINALRRRKRRLLKNRLVAVGDAFETNAANMAREPSERSLRTTRELIKQQLKAAAITAEAEYENLLRVRVSPGRLKQLAGMPGVRYVRLPHRPVPAVISEGVGLTGTASYHSSGFTGAGVTVAIIDAGFDNLTEAIASGELPGGVMTQDFTGTGIETTGVHGTAVAEIVHDMAPAADLWLLKVGDTLDLGNAKNFAMANGADIISMSLLFPGDGFVEDAGLSDGIANDARANAILWVNAAGNSAAGKHWRGPFVDTLNDGIHEFSPGVDETNAFIGVAGEVVTIVLTWDDWPGSNQDYDLALLDPFFNLVALSDGLQTGTQEPFEIFSYTVAVNGLHHVVIVNSAAEGTSSFEMYAFSTVPGLQLQYPVATTSLLPPADATGVIAVGAIDEDNWTLGPQEAFSSQGPTNDGRIKPDIMGPDDTASFTYSPLTFAGTSASAPHVAGALALLKQANPSMTPDQLENLLYTNAVDMGATGQDNIFGRGRMQLPAPSVALGVSVNPTTWAIGMINPGATAQMNEDNDLTVSNTGNVAETMTLRVKTPGAPWLPGSAAGIDTYLLRGLFVGSADAPGPGDFQGDDTILYGETPSEASASQFGAAGMSDNGVGVPAGNTADLWLSFTGPSQTDEGSEQSIVVEIGAVPTP